MGASSILAEVSGRTVQSIDAAYCTVSTSAILSQWAVRIDGTLRRGTLVVGADQVTSTVLISHALKTDSRVTDWLVERTVSVGCARSDRYSN